MTTGDPYALLTHKVGFPHSTRLRRIFEAVCTQEEAEVLAECPGTVDEIAQKLNRPKETVAAQLQDMADKGLAMGMPMPDGSQHYSLITAPEMLTDGMMWSIGGLSWDDKTHTLTDPKVQEIADLILDFCENEWYRWERVDELVHKRVKLLGGVTTFTIFPAWKALEKSEKSGLDLPESHWFWDARQAAQRAKSILVAVCPCRIKAKQCDAPIYTCTLIDIGMLPEWYFQRAVERGVRQAYSPEQWLQVMGECEERGMVHIGVPPIGFGCTCCTCCCNIFHPLYEYAKPSEGLEKTPFRAVVNKDACEGCPDCVKYCRFQAIKIRKDGGKNKAVVDVEKCFGCGQCVVQCKVEGAIKLELADKLAATV